jgi:hypothetical protein
MSLLLRKPTPMANCCRSCVEAQTIAGKADVPISDAACLRFTSRQQEADKGHIGIMRSSKILGGISLAAGQYGHRIELVTNQHFLNELPQAETPLRVRRGHSVGIHGLTLDEVGRRIEYHLASVLYAVADLDRRAAVADHGELADATMPFSTLRPLRLKITASAGTTRDWVLRGTCSSTSQ